MVELATDWSFLRSLDSSCASYLIISLDLLTPFIMFTMITALYVKVIATENGMQRLHIMMIVTIFFVQQQHLRLKLV